jgi:Tfp pilus assembly protein PilO
MLGKSLNIILVILVGAFIVYTGYFLANLLYSTGDIAELEKKQDESKAAKQVRFNEKTLESLESLTPASGKPDTSNVGKENPFSPN